MTTSDWPAAWLAMTSQLHGYHRLAHGHGSHEISCPLAWLMEEPPVPISPCALFAWKLSDPFLPRPAPSSNSEWLLRGAIVGYLTEWDAAYRRDLIVQVVHRRAFSEPPLHRARRLRSPPSPLVECRGCSVPCQRPRLGCIGRQWSDFA